MIFSSYVSSTVNNTLTEAEKDKDRVKEPEKGKETDLYTDKDISKTKEKDAETKTEEKEKSVEGKDTNTGLENTPEVDGEDRYTGTIPDKTVAKGRNEGELEERRTGWENSTEGGENKVDSKENGQNTTEEKQPEARKPPEKEERDSDSEKKEIPEIVVKNKGQEEKERKEEQVNGKRDPGKIGPNDTKQRTVIPEGGNTVEIFELDITKNSTGTHDLKDSKKENNTIGPPVPGRKTILSRVNVTQHTLYRADEENGQPKEKATTKHDETEKEPLKKTMQLEEKKEEKEKEKEKKLNESFGKRFFEANNN